MEGTLFRWMLPIFKAGALNALELDDLPQLAKYDTSTNLKLFQQGSNKRLKGSLSLRILASFWKGAARVGALSLINVFASYIGPCLIYAFVDYLDDNRQDRRLGLGMAAAFLASRILELISERNRFFRDQILNLRICSSLVASIYSKGIRLSSSARSKHSAGEIINYMSSDAEIVAGFIAFHLYTPLLIMLQVSIAAGILYKSLGLPAFPSVAALVLGAASNIPLARVQEGFQAQVAKSRDSRMKSTTECLKNMRALKFHAWEQAYLDRLAGFREAELAVLKKLLFIRDGSRLFAWIFPMAVAATAFGLCAALGTPLSTKSVLASLVTFQSLQKNLLEELTSFVPSLAGFRVSLQRLATFLEEEEVPSREDGSYSGGLEPGSISIVDGTFSWEGTKPVLFDFNLEVEPGTTLGVCGAVGSGKSSLLSCLLGDMLRLTGKVHVTGRIGYVPQSAWILSGTVEENILFGQPMNRDRYEETIRVCQLGKDLSMLQFGDQTHIGERGVNLSGGQKQRIQLARAVYHDADVYLLDDPFSALDVHTRSKIIEECIYGMLKSKTIVLATHHPDMFRPTDRILLLNAGRIVEVLPSSELQPQLKTGIHPSELQLDENEAGTEAQFAKGEDRKRGAVSLSTYKMYLRAVRSGAWIPVILAAHALFELAHISGSWYLASSPKQSLVSFTVLCLTGSIFLGVRVRLVSIIGLATAQKFFCGFLHSIFHAPMSFFDETPSSRILTRSFTDQASLDLNAPQRLGGLAFSCVQLIFILGMMSQVPLVLVILFPVAAACIWLQRYYARTIRELPRLVAIHQAPVIHHLAESLAGALVIRSFGQEHSFIRHNLVKIDNHMRPVFYNFSAMECLALHTGLLVNLVFAAFMLALVALPPTYTFDLAMAGVAVTYALQLNAIQCSLVWDFCDAEKRVIAAERIQQYTNILKEAGWYSGEVPNFWPSKGDIEFRNLQVRYSPTSPLVLKGISCKISGGERISVIGRTGSGKSTLVQCLFRIVEPGWGQIYIDGLDVKSVGLHELRSNMVIIPQEPIMFEGSVRQNLDSLGKRCNDSELWEVLDKCWLFGDVSRRELKLDSPVVENGENWSLGQRQLFCLARMLLDKGDARIVVLDEATASVDNETHKAFQLLVQEQYKGSTIISIMHRLDSIKSSDMVMVLSDGELSSYTRPEQLQL